MKPAYHVEPRKKCGTKRGKWWIVITPDGRIANNHYHVKEKSAQRHCENLNAYFGGDS